MNGLTGMHPDVIHLHVASRQERLLHEAAAGRLARDARAFTAVRLAAGRTLVRLGQALAGPAEPRRRTRSIERRSTIRTVKADGC